jgi:hypothetical protein
VKAVQTVLIGVDFDNTIVCYDELFRQVALEWRLIPPTIPASKNAVREYLRRSDQEDQWTELQGYVYGARMQEARPFSGVLAFFARCRKSRLSVRIISHRSPHPYRGECYDLHQAAREWLAANGFFDVAGIGLEASDVWLELTKQDKLARIASTGCSHFIDDLPEFLAEPGFPAGVQKILFDPNGVHPVQPAARCVGSWAAIERLLLAGEP